MGIPRHTFEPTGDPVVDDLNFFMEGTQGVKALDWFKANTHVLIHTPEQIIRDAEPFWLMADIPADHGIYVLLDGERIAYVGKALSVNERVHAHWRNRKPFNRFWCFGGVPYSWLDCVESVYIARLRPYLNRMNVPGDPRVDSIAKKALAEAAPAAI